MSGFLTHWAYRDRLADGLLSTRRAVKCFKEVCRQREEYLSVCWCLMFYIVFDNVLCLSCYSSDFLDLSKSDGEKSLTTEESTISRPVFRTTSDKSRDMRALWGVFTSYAWRTSWWRPTLPCSWAFLWFGRSQNIGIVSCPAGCTLVFALRAFTLSPSFCFGDLGLFQAKQALVLLD